MTLDYKLLRTSKTKGIKLTINKIGELEVRAGKSVQVEEIEAFIIKHKRWVVNQRARIVNREETIRRYSTGDVIMLHGIDYPVRYIDEIGRSYFDRSEVVIYTASRRNNTLASWYTRYATDYLTNMFSIYARDICPVKVKKVNSYYGCCYRRGQKTYISLNEALVHGDDECIRYVINHELSHLKVPNHSAAFYKELSDREPNYREIELRLKRIVTI